MTNQEKYDFGNRICKLAEADRELANGISFRRVFHDHSRWVYHNSGIATTDATRWSNVWSEIGMVMSECLSHE